MTKKERAKLEEALFHLMDNEGSNYTKGIGLLCELLGQRYPAWHDTQNLRLVPLHEIKPNDTFRWPGIPGVAP